MTSLYHTSPTKLNAIKADGVFGGIFASTSKESALSHHSNLHVINLNDDEILKNYALNYELDYNTVKTALESIVSSDNFDRVWEIVVEQSQLTEDDFSLFDTDNFADASWTSQKIRGQLAQKLGYKAIEMDDEHGTSYLVLSTAKIEAI